MAMWESMGPIADRSQDHPGASDLAVAQFRRMMVAAAKKFTRRRSSHRQREGPALREPGFLRRRDAEERGLAHAGHRRGNGRGEMSSFTSRCTTPRSAPTT